MKIAIKRMVVMILCCFSALGYGAIYAQDKEKGADSVDMIEHNENPWYKKIALRGYMQMRYNRLLETNPNLRCEQCDASWGGSSGFFLRRMRLVFYGQLSERLYMYVQPDFASSVGENLNFGQLRDAYFDLGLDRENTFRLRIGQSKVPFGFENMQSSQNRLPLDRNDGINSAFKNERDLGIFFYWAPGKIRQRFARLVSEGLKGSGDYGVFALGAFSGQTANKPDLNNSLHVVTRFSYPFELKNKQIVEPGIQFYTGKYVVSDLSEGVMVNGGAEYLDRRAALSFVLYPQPFGLQAEYNIGTGPEYNSLTNSVDQKDLRGGYVLANYRFKLAGEKHFLYPFLRYHYYDGGKKFERDARSYTVRELEIGAEWQPFKNVEFVAMYTMSDRRYEDAALPINRQEGNLLRMQLQFNF